MVKNFHRKVQHGDKLGRKIGFPTLNFRTGKFGDQMTHGVYACCVFIAGAEYKGALHFGPKMPSQKVSLEVHVINFNQSIYGQFVRFQVLKKIREPMTFDSLDDLKRQIERDVDGIIDR